MTRRPARPAAALAVLALFAGGVFAANGLSARPCQARSANCPSPSTTAATTAASVTTTQTTTTVATTTAVATTTTTAAATTTTTATTTTAPVTTTSSGPTVVDHYVTPEGATIDVYSDAVGWTSAQAVYTQLLKPNAYQLALVGPHLTVDVTARYASATSASASSSNGVWNDYHATMYLQASSGSAFSSTPDAVAAHEYGHAWSLYHYFLTENGSWAAYRAARGLTGNSLLDTSYMWNTREIVAEDYRELFGDAAAQAELAQMNYQIPTAAAVSGLQSFLAGSW